MVEKKIVIVIVIVIVITFYFTKLPWPGNSERTFRSSSQAATCPPVYHTRRRLHTVPLIAERQAGKLWIPIFIVFGLTRPGIEPESTVSVADALSTRPLIALSTCFIAGGDNKKCIRMLRCVRKPCLHAAPHRIQTQLNKFILHRTASGGFRGGMHLPHQPKHNVHMHNIKH